MRVLTEIKSALQYIGGVEEELPAALPAWLQRSLFWGCWWAFLILLILVFCGQTSKFIYIDF